ncbi:hypothetical protein L6164_030002 [Bauhinia variegata]|uniref:Uncharacterized protein n=1 Tax=Bauhinia variegata TaxID=167791 RepID=A0ACB9LB39_BAUVA|nr:hypothetical protein L6164_030002 [Bauhinia variegata]
MFYKGELSFFIWAAFVGYSCTLIFAVSKLRFICLLDGYDTHVGGRGLDEGKICVSFGNWRIAIAGCFITVQALVNTLGDLRGSLAAVERINSVLFGVEIDEALAYGLEGELKRKEVNDQNYKLLFSINSAERSQNGAAKAANAHDFMISLCRAMTHMLVQGLVNTLGDLCGSLAAVERINSVLFGVEIDEALAYGLEGELKQKEVDDQNYKLLFSINSAERSQSGFFLTNQAG